MNSAPSPGYIKASLSNKNVGKYFISSDLSKKGYMPSLGSVTASCTLLSPLVIVAISPILYSRPCTDANIILLIPLIKDYKFNRCAIIENVLKNSSCDKLRLGDVGSYIRGLTYSSNDVVECNGTLVMRSNNIVNGSSLDYTNNVVSVNKQISQEQQLQDGDIIICMANGSSALVGKSSFYDGKCSLPITVGAFCGIYRSKMPITKWLFQTNRYRRYIWNSLQGGNGAIANLNSEDILRMSFPLPDKQIVEHCTKLLSSLESLIESNVSLCSMFSQQKEYLLRQMFI